MSSLCIVLEVVFDLSWKRHLFGSVTIFDNTALKIKVFMVCFVDMRVEMSLLQVSQHERVITCHHSFSQKSSKNLTIWVNVTRNIGFWGKSRSLYYILSITHDISSFVYSFSSIINGFGHVLSILVIFARFSRFFINYSWYLINYSWYIINYSSYSLVIHDI